MQKAAIFDLDGTLLYTLEDLKDSVNFALEEFSYPARSLEEIRSFVGNGIKLLIVRAIPNGIENPNFERCLECFKTHYAENMYNKTKPFEKIDEMLETLRFRGYKIGVVSNKFDKAVKELCKKYFADKIDIAIGENEALGIHKKPAPDGVFSAMEILKCDKTQTYFIGDSEVDIQTAKNCEIPYISVTWGYKARVFLEENGAKIIAETPEDILKILR